MRKIRYNTFETNSSSTHSLVILSKEDYEAWQRNEKTLDLYTGKVQDLTDSDKEIIRNEDGVIEYKGEKFDDIYDFMESADYYDVIEESNASPEFVERYGDVEETELDGKKNYEYLYRREMVIC